MQAVEAPDPVRRLVQRQPAPAPGNAGLLRERADLAREIPALRLQIDAARQQGDAVRLAALEQLQGRREARLRALDAALGLAGDSVDGPIRLDALQQALGDGEVYFKIVDIRGAVFGLVVGKERTSVYPVAASARQLAALADTIGGSLRSGEPTGVFPVAAAATLFEQIAGPSVPQLRGAKRLVYDPAEALRGVPAGVLVTDAAAMAPAIAPPTRKDVPQRVNYSAVPFLARQTDIATALSVSSFLDARRQGQAEAGKPFLGVAEIAGLPAGCTAPRSAAVRPMPEPALARAANALGVVDAPIVRGTEIADEARSAGGELGRYQVLHFATSGSPEALRGCTTAAANADITSGASAATGLVAVDAIAALKLNANLVVLATAARRADTTAEDEGTTEALVPAFLAADARAVLASHWPVEAGPQTDLLFETFYRGGRTETIGAALRSAQTALIATGRYSHPHFWAGYFVAGDAGKSMLSDKGGR